MRTTIYLCCLLVLIFSQAAQASFNSHNTQHLLIDYTKAKSNLVRSKSPYTKYALVRFILDKGDDFSRLGGTGGGGGGGTGGVITPNLTRTPDAGCTAAAYPYTSNVMLQNCASISQCFDGTTYRMKCTSCKNNMGLSGGKCTCSTSGYTYTEESGCPSGAELDRTVTNATCSEIGSNGLTKVYYKSCVCPSVYQYTCTGTGQEGVGIGCSVNGQAKKYAECACKSSYSTSCDSSDVNPSGAACYDTVLKKNYYTACTCSSSFKYTCTGAGQVGVGVGCSADGVRKYTDCSCSSSYTQTCDSGNSTPSGAACYNTLLSKNYYTGCTASCDISKGEIRSLDEYWCNHGWVEFPNVRTFFQ